MTNWICLWPHGLAASSQAWSVPEPFRFSAGRFLASLRFMLPRRLVCWFLGLLVAGGLTAAPRVLLLGDSISMAYTPLVAAALTNEAVVVRPTSADGKPENCEGTTRALTELDRWLALGDGRWDVIHFNFGLHDLKRVQPQSGAPSSDPAHPHQADVRRYEAQLREIMARLQKTGATLIFATTTPVPSGRVSPHRDPEDVPRYNAVAQRLAAEAGIRVNDLYSAVLPRAAELQRPANVHFTGAGSQFLADAVVREIRAALAAPPNVVIILADDLGWGDLGCYNPGSKIPTPHLNRLAAQGMRFTDAHSPSAVCTPTRYGLLTGRYAWRTRLKRGVLWGYSPPLIEPDRPTLATHLKNRGYATACVGKWHLGLGWTTREPADFGDGSIPTADPVLVDFAPSLTSGPHTLGFDYSFILPASLDMDPYVFIEDGRVAGVPTNRVAGSRSQRQGGGGFWREGPVSPGFTHEGVEADLLARAAAFIRRQTNSARPFLLYLPLASPHDPWVPRPEFRGRSTAGVRGDFVAQVDDTVGRLLKVLEETGLAENTLVVFTSDNGAHWLPKEVEETGHHANGHWRGMKSDAFEGGHRVPFLARWPGVIQPGSTTAALVGLNDLFATVSEAAGLTVPPGAAEDSVSFLPVLRGEASGVRESLVLHSINGAFALRQHDWKLIEAKDSGGWTTAAVETPAQLYHLRDDPGETNNLAASEPDKLRELLAALARLKP